MAAIILFFFIFNSFIIESNGFFYHPFYFRQQKAGQDSPGGPEEHFEGVFKQQYLLIMFSDDSCREKLSSRVPVSKW